MGEYGESRAHFNDRVYDTYKKTKKGCTFDRLPEELKEFEEWQPSFTLLSEGEVRVVFRAKPVAAAEDLERWKATNLARVWWTTVLIPAVHSLPAGSRTRLFNATATIQATGIPPSYLRLYAEDMRDLDVALSDATANSPLNVDLSWWFLHARFGHRCELDGEVGPEAFGLAPVRHGERVQVHRAPGSQL